MKSLIMHCDQYKAIIMGISNSSKISMKSKKGKLEKMNDCIVALICIEKNDTKEKTNKLIREIEKILKELNCDKIMIGPFAHLSKNLEEPKRAKKLIDYIEEKLKFKHQTLKSCFGFHKSLLLDVKGHPGNIKWREF